MQAKGRIVVQLYDDVPIGATRFADLARGIQGVGFRRTKFDAVNEVRQRPAKCSVKGRCLAQFDWYPTIEVV